MSYKAGLRWLQLSVLATLCAAQALELQLAILVIATFKLLF